jgi:hypothetical protein
MSSEPSLLPRKWFAAAATFSLLLAGLAAFLLFAPHPREPGIGLALPTTLGLRQRGEDGLVIPWGTTISGTGLRIEVAGADPQRSGEIELFLSQNGAPPQRLKHDGTGADLKQLTPGRYRWSAVVHLPGDVPMALEPPRGDPLAGDFFVAPLALELPSLQQRTLEGKESIEIGGKTRAGAKLGAQFPEALPGAVLEVESKLVASAFDGSGARRIPVEKGDVSIDFAGPDGAYRWRARLVATAQLRTEWRAFSVGPGGDFVIFAAPATQAPKDDSGGGHDDGSGPTNKNSDTGRNSNIPPNGTSNPKDKSASGKNSADPGGNSDSNPNDNNQAAGKNSGDPSGKGDAGGANKNKGSGKNPDKPAGNGDPKEPDKNQDPKQNPGGAGKGTPGARAYSSGMGSGYRGPLPSRVRPLPSLWHLAVFRMGLIFGGIIATLGVLLITMRVIRAARPRAASVP